MKTNSFENLASVTESIKKLLIDKKSLLIYAPNSTGKTIISRKISENVTNEKELLCFNAFVEETFDWINDFDNDEYYLKIKGSDVFISESIITFGLEPEINKNFRKLINEKIDANFYVENGRITKVDFSLKTGDGGAVENIKISKAEESLFIWAVFYTIVDQATSLFIDNDSDYFKNLKYIIIDDPVTSLGDEKIVSVAIAIRENIASKINGKIGLLITTHNRLLFNILHNEMKNRSAICLLKEDNIFKLVEQKDSPFGYHLKEISDIKKAIQDNVITKTHFSMFRNILEKTSNFLGYRNWDKCINDNISEKDRIIRLINSYSHDSLNDLDDKIINNDEFLLYKETFEKFIEDFKWGE